MAIYGDGKTNFMAWQPINWEEVTQCLSQQFTARLNSFILSDKDAAECRRLIEEQQRRFEELTIQTNNHLGPLLLKAFDNKPLPKNFARWFFDGLSMTDSLDPRLEIPEEIFLEYCKQKRMQILAMLDEYATKVDKPNVSPRNLPKSFVWIGRNTDEALFRRAIIKNFLCLGAKHRYFDEAFFCDGILSKSFKPLRWKSNNASELKYFYRRIIQLRLISGNTKRLDYLSLCNVFVKSDASPFANSFKSLNINLDSNLSNNTKTKVESILAPFSY